MPGHPAERRNALCDVWAALGRERLQSTEMQGCAMSVLSVILFWGLVFLVLRAMDEGFE